MCDISLAHKEPCYKKGKHAPVSAEEPQSVDNAKHVLFDKDGTYCGDDVAVFARRIHSDNDTRGPESFIRTQNELIG